MKFRPLPGLTVRLLLPTLLLTALTVSVRAQTPDVETKTITYKIGADTFEGSVTRPAKVSGPTPGVLVVHDWMGYGEFSRARCEQLAKLGYIAFAVDMYGKGVHAKNSDEAKKLAGAFYQDFSRFRTRSQAALAELLKQPDVDPKRIGAIGFCFGGTTVLELARSGADVLGVVSFHGGLKTSTPAIPDTIKAKELIVLHGSLDPNVPPADVAGFMQEMNTVKEPYRLVAYPNAVHAFTNPEAGSDLSKGVAYNQPVAEAAYKEMQEFFARIFAK